MWRWEPLVRLFYHKKCYRASRALSADQWVAGTVAVQRVPRVSSQIQTRKLVDSP